MSPQKSGPDVFVLFHKVCMCVFLLSTGLNQRRILRKKHGPFKSVILMSVRVCRQCNSGFRRQSSQPFVPILPTILSLHLLRGTLHVVFISFIWSIVGSLALGGLAGCLPISVWSPRLARGALRRIASFLGTGRLAQLSSAFLAHLLKVLTATM